MFKAAPFSIYAYMSGCKWAYLICVLTNDIVLISSKVHGTLSKKTK
jgi:hypothetical protein